MQEQEFTAKLETLIEKIEHLPPEHRVELERLAEQTRARHTQMRKNLDELQNSLDHLRLSVKYLVFDLEATRRENTYLRKLVEDDGKPGH